MRFDFAKKSRRRVFPALLLALALLVYWFWQYRLTHSQDAVIRAAAARYRLDPALVKAIVWRESGFHPNARGRAGEIGLMQLREDAAQEWADSEHVIGFVHEDCLDPRTNTLAGTWYLKKLLKRYRQTDNPIPYALADYNAGRANLLKWNSGAAQTNSSMFLEQIGFPGTRQYVEDILNYYEKHRQLTNSDPSSR